MGRRGGFRHGHLRRQYGRPDPRPLRQQSAAHHNLSLIHILPVHITDEQLESWKASLPELPAQRRRRFMDEWKLPEQDADIITSDRAQADLFEAAVALYNEPRKIANYMTGPMLREINQTGVVLKDSALKPEALAELAKIVDGGLISAKIAQDIFSELYANGVMPEAYVREKRCV